MANCDGSTGQSSFDHFPSLQESHGVLRFSSLDCDVRSFSELQLDNCCWDRKSRVEQLGLKTVFWYVHVLLNFKVLLLSQHVIYCYMFFFFSKRVHINARGQCHRHLLGKQIGRTKAIS